MSLAIHIAEDDVDGANAGDDVRDDLPFNKFRKRLQINKRRGAEMATQRLWRAIAGDEATKLATRRFHGDVGLAGRRRKTLSENLEVVDECFHLRLHFFALRWNDARRLGLYGA